MKKRMSAAVDSCVIELRMSKFLSKYRATQQVGNTILSMIARYHERFFDASFFKEIADKL